MTVQSSHEAVSALLPWYANSTLTAEESAVVKQHLESCAQCAEELQLFYAVGVVMTEAADNAPPVTASLAKTFSAIDDLEKRPQEGRRGFAAWFDALWNPPAPLARLVFAGQLAAILLLGVLLMLPAPEQPFNTLSGTGAGAVSGTRLTMMFSPGVTEEAMRRALLEVDARIVAGPSALGVYVVEVPIKPEQDSKIEAVIARLRLNAKTVRFVEREP
jgi:anti-sigma factor RsiW